MGCDGMGAVPDSIIVHFWLAVAQGGTFGAQVPEPRPRAVHARLARECYTNLRTIFSTRFEYGGYSNRGSGRWGLYSTDLWWLKASKPALPW
jgi:hypothetical protein